VTRGCGSSGLRLAHVQALAVRSEHPGRDRDDERASERHPHF
jgi:hypothetical protein